MKQQENTRPACKGKHLTYPDRRIIEAMRKKHTIKEIATAVGCNRRTVERELKRGQVRHINTNLTVTKVYNADAGQDHYNLNATAKGPDLKLGDNYKMVELISDKIKEEKQSPAVIAHHMKTIDFPGRVCAKTIYSYIDQELIEGVTNADLWEKSSRRKGGKRAYRAVKKVHIPRTSIEKRPKEIEDREEFGHWEIDLIVSGQGRSKVALLTLTERVTREVIIRKLPNKTQRAVIRAINGIERSYGSERFKTITADNGSEFLDMQGMEKSVFGTKKRFKMYYAHPYSSWERGSNENNNRMIRRFVKKGCDIKMFTCERLQTIEDWINNYPRKIIGFQTAQELFNQKVAA
jgi:IS30 family transposase